jgi:hypothetical protein
MAVTINALSVETYETTQVNSHKLSRHEVHRLSGHPSSPSSSSTTTRVEPSLFSRPSYRPPLALSGGHVLPPSFLSYHHPASLSTMSPSHSPSPPPASQPKLVGSAKKRERPPVLDIPLHDISHASIPHSIAGRDDSAQDLPDALHVRSPARPLRQGHLLNLSITA